MNVLFYGSVDGCIFEVSSLTILIFGWSTQATAESLFLPQYLDELNKVIHFEFVDIRNPSCKNELPRIKWERLFFFKNSAIASSEYLFVNICLVQVDIFSLERI